MANATVAPATRKTPRPHTDCTPETPWTPTRRTPGPPYDFHMTNERREIPGGQSVNAQTFRDAAECECVLNCAENPKTACSLSGRWHVHPEWPCPIHPEAPGDR